MLDEERIYYLITTEFCLCVFYSVYVFMVILTVDMYSFGRVGVGGWRRNSADCEGFGVCALVWKKS